MRFLALLSIAAPFLGTPLHAQSDAPVEPGTRIRVFFARQAPTVEGAAFPQVLRGTVETVSTDSLVLRFHPGAQPVQLSWGAVRRLDESRGVPTRLASALRGMGEGAALGVVYLPIFDDREETKLFRSRPEDILINALLGGAAGAVMGAWRPQERWRRIRLARPPA